MEAVNQFLGLAVIFAGIIMGSIVALIAKEELKSGRKYFLALEKFMIAGILLLSIFFAQHTVLKIVFAAILVYLFVFKFSFNDIIIYLLFGFIYFIFANNFNILILLSSLMFLYGFPAGTMTVCENYSKSYKPIIKIIVYRYIWIMIIGMALFWVI